ncbi:hypothetical protein X975_14634, partial [Stegodyphus mimosarum]
MCKTLVILNSTVSGLIDTGSEVTLLTQNTWIQLGSPPLSNNSGVLTGFGFSKIPIIGYFQTIINIDNQDFPANIRVIPNHSVQFSLIVGCDVIKNAKLTITPDGIYFSQPEQYFETKPESFIFAINDDVPAFDIGSNVSKETRAAAERLLNSYAPNKTKTTDIKLNITLSDDKLIFHPPRRLPFVEREIVGKQLNEWLKLKIIEPCSSPYASQVL